MNGKSKCKILKDIRRKIAEDNEIAYITSECKYQGDCSGTCPKCEAEVRYLESELEKRQKMGKAVAVAGIAAAVMIGTSGCELPFLGPTGGDPLPNPNYSEEQQIPGGVTLPTEEELMGVPVETTTPPTVEIMGDMAPPYE